VCKAVIKAKGGYFEESQILKKIIIIMFNTFFVYCMIPYVLFHCVDVFTIILHKIVKLIVIIMT
jgi:hypothetical protein